MAVDSEALKGSLLVMGRIAAPFGVKGWLRVTAYTAEPENLLDYTPWYFGRQGDWQTVELISGRRHGKGLVVQLKDCNDRDAAALLTGTEIGVYRSQLPAVESNDFYWSDLIGLQVVTSSGIYGKILAIEENVITLEVADKVKIRILRDRIAGRWPTPSAADKK